MLDIIALHQRKDLFKQAVEVFWSQWGTDANYNFYYDCMIHSRDEGNLPQFYIAVQNESIIGTYSLLRDDLISRQDLFPWLACLYVAPRLRGNKLGSKLIQHALQSAYERGFENLYLCTDLDGYYEKYGWDYMTDGYTFDGHQTKIYVRNTTN